MNADRRRALSPIWLWAGILAGPVAWAVDLPVSYAAVKPACRAASTGVIHGITAASLLVIAAGAAISWRSLRHADARSTDGGQPEARARFMAVLGLLACGLFALQVLANAIPTWVIDACL
jgi:hypothetical protein